MPRWLKAEFFLSPTEAACTWKQAAHSEEHCKELQMLQHLCGLVFLRAHCHFRMSFTLLSVDYMWVCAVYICLQEAGQHLDVLTKLRSSLECLDCRGEPNTAVLAAEPHGTAADIYPR